MKKKDLKTHLDEAVLRFNNTDFIDSDPILIPHRFTKLQDIEISGFWVSMLAWGQRKTIIKSANGFLERMDNAPHDFVLNHQETDLKVFEDFKHRTFQPIDALYFIHFFKHYYQEHESMETAFAKWISPEDVHIGNGLKGFHEQFFSYPDAPNRTKKHVATPSRKSTCKRMNMFLRWMVRKDDTGVDLGLWNTIKPSQLLMPLDVHVDRVARKFGLIQRKQTDWQTVLELTAQLRNYCPEDPVKYDFALFGLGLETRNAL